MSNYTIRDFSQIVEKWAKRFEIPPEDAGMMARREAFDLGGRMTDNRYTVPSEAAFTVAIKTERER